MQICNRVHDRLAQLADELGFELGTTDVDGAAAAGDTALRAEFGDRLPVVLLDGVEHSYWEIDEPRLRADLAATGATAERRTLSADSGCGEPARFKPVT